MNNIEIQTKTRQALQYVKERGHRPVYIGLYGSQNYGLDIYDIQYQSDLDWKCIIIPTLEELVMNTAPVSTVLEFEGGQIDVKDIRVFVASLVKCNVNFLEIFSTEFFITEKIDMMQLRTMVPQLMRDLGFLYLKACYGMMKEKEAALRHPYPKTAAKIKLFGYDPKQLHHIYRLKILIDRYVESSKKDFIANVTNFKHYGKEQEQLIHIKKGFVPDAEVDKSVEWLMTEAKNKIESFKREPSFKTKDKMVEIAKNLIIKEIICEIKENRYLSPSLMLPSQKDIVNTVETNLPVTSTACVKSTTKNGIKPKTIDSSVAKAPAPSTENSSESETLPKTK